MTSTRFDGLCRLAGLCRTCTGMDYTHALGPGNGPLDAPVLFVAEAPGRRGAARTGVPLTADVAGRRFELLLAAAGIARSDVFVTNAVLCNPLNERGRNRRPTRAELIACNGFLKEQLALVSAPLVVALGAVALEALGHIEHHGLSLARDAGRPTRWAGRTLLPLYHPGFRSTMARRHESQLADWRALGRLARDIGARLTV